MKLVQESIADIVGSVCAYNLVTNPCEGNQFGSTFTKAEDITYLTAQSLTQNPSRRVLESLLDQLNTSKPKYAL